MLFGVLLCCVGSGLVGLVGLAGLAGLVSLATLEHSLGLLSALISLSCSAAEVCIWRAIVSQLHQCQCCCLGDNKPNL